MNLTMQSEEEAFKRTKVKLWIAVNLNCVLVVLLMVGGGIQSRKCQAVDLHSLLGEVISELACSHLERLPYISFVICDLKHMECQKC